MRSACSLSHWSFVGDNLNLFSIIYLSLYEHLVLSLGSAGNIVPWISLFQKPFTLRADLAAGINLILKRFNYTSKHYFEDNDKHSRSSGFFFDILYKLTAHIYGKKNQES